MTVLRRLVLTAAVLAAVFLFITRPSAPLATQGGPSASPSPTVRGAYHIHTRRSDGALDKADVAAVAARAGLQFAIFTDHGDGTRPSDPPEYIHGVLCLDGVEISTTGGHYVALGMGTAPYPLGGEPSAVVEDVRRLGGFGIAAHPTSPNPELAWTDWNAPIDGIEWLNADSEWRDEGRLRMARVLIDYFTRPAGALAETLDRPDEALRQWDRLASSRPIVGLAAHDAHGGVGAEAGNRAGRRLHVPSYDATFRTFSNYVRLPAALTGDAAADAAALLESIRGGRVFAAIDALSAPASLEFGGPSSSSGAARSIPAFSARAAVPRGAETAMVRNGAVVATAAGGAIEYRDGSSGAFRVEVRVPGAPGHPPVPWLVSNPIYVLPQVTPTDAVASGPSIEWQPPAWHVEHAEGSTATAAAAASGTTLTFALGAGGAVSPFAALAGDVKGLASDAAWLHFKGSASRPMRVSVQVRYGNDAASRFGRSVFLDGSVRDVTLRIDTLRPLDAQGARPPHQQATSILFVVDLVNARTGDSGSFTVDEVGLARER